MRAFATAARQDKALFDALATAVKQRLGEFNALDLVDTAWAFAKVAQPDVALFVALAEAVNPRLGEFKA